MALLTARALSASGVDPTQGAPATLAGDRFHNTGRQLLVVSNYSGDSIDVTIDTPMRVDGARVDTLEVTVPDGETRVFGPFAPWFRQRWLTATRRWARGSTARVSYSGNTNAFVQVLKLPG